jgi:hypothetical protein
MAKANLPMLEAGLLAILFKGIAIPIPILPEKSIAIPIPILI